MSAFTIDAKAIADKIKANFARLDACDCHNFESIANSDTTFRRSRCTRCGGEVDSLYVLWYERGVEHGKKLGGVK